MSLRMARISVAALHGLMQAGAAPVIVMCARPRRVRSNRSGFRALCTFPCRMRRARLKELPRDRDIVVYCTCPSEASAARVAKVLMNNGFKHVRPLQGGLDAWIEAGYAVDTGVGAADLLGTTPWCIM